MLRLSKFQTRKMENHDLNKVKNIIIFSFNIRVI